MNDDLSDLADLLDSLRDVRATIAEWRADDVFPGDQGFQRLLTQESELEERIQAIYDTQP